MKQVKRCDLCVYYDNESLECMRLPPQIIGNVKPSVPNTAGFQNENFITRFPHVNNHRWCGEFKEQR